MVYVYLYFSFLSNSFKKSQTSERNLKNDFDHDKNNYNEY